MRSDLHLIVMEIFQFCVEYNIVLEVHWIPRSEIDRADYISRIIDVDDWKMPAACFASLDTYLGGGVHTVNCFASFYDKKIGKFFSRLWNPGCNGVGFFGQKFGWRRLPCCSPCKLYFSSASLFTWFQGHRHFSCTLVAIIIFLTNCLQKICQFHRGL